MADTFKMTVELTATSFPSLMGIARQVFGEILAAKSIKNIPRSGGGGSSSGHSISFSVTLITPVEARIAELRREADELEAGLKIDG